MTGEFSYNSTILVHPVCSSLSRAVFFLFVLVLSLVFPACFVLVLFCTRCKYSFLRHEPLRDRLVNYAFIFNVTNLE